MKDLNEIEKYCNGCTAGTLIGGLGTLALTGFVFTLGAVAIPISATAAVIGGTVGKKLDKSNK